MARGFVWAIYVDDQGGSWATRVDAEYAADPDRGWATEGVETLPVLSRMHRKRQVVGLDELGAEQHAVAGSVAAPIWTREVATFVFKANDGFDRVADIIGRRSEWAIRPG